MLRNGCVFKSLDFIDVKLHLIACNALNKRIVKLLNIISSFDILEIAICFNKN
jgi:hypothetical protein